MHTFLTHKKLFAIYLFQLFFIHQAFSKDFKYQDYDWEKTRKMYSLSADEQKESAVVLKDKTAIEYSYNLNGELVVYYTVHKIIKVNNDDAIEENNKVYISLYNTLDIIDLKVRTIANNKIVETDKKNIKEIKNLDDHGAYKIFAIEGAEKGCEIEYFYTLKKQSFYFGREYFQGPYIIKDSDFELISPENLVFETKGYNGFPTLKDSLIDKKREISIFKFSAPAKSKEEYSFNNPNLMRLEYKLSYNTSKGKSKILTWSEASQRIYENTHDKNAKTDPKIVKLIQSLNLEKLPGEEEKIKEIEKYIKNNIVLKEGSEAELSLIPAILKNKYASTLGVIKLYVKIFEASNIKHSIVLTTDRSNLRFDPDFESFDFLDNYLFFFSNFNKFLAPSVSQYRYPMIPYNWTNNYGLFIKTVTLGSFNTGLGEVLFIPAADYKTNADNMDISLNFIDGLSKVSMHLKRYLWGESGMYIQPYYSLLPTEKKKMIEEEILKGVVKNSIISNVKLENIDRNMSPAEKPFIIEADMDIDVLLEKTGKKYLFKIGEIIGPQAEMYQDKKRINDIENQFNRQYKRHIEFTIPNGYQVKNLADLKIQVFYEEKGEKTLAFLSDYEMKGNTVTINIDEYYKKINYSASVIEPFRKVINGAADFNKVTLVFEEK